MEQGGRRVADGHDRSLQVIAPQVDGRGGAGGAQFGGEAGGALVVEQAQDLVVGGEAAAGDAGLDHRDVGENRLARLQRGAGGGDGAGGEHDVPGQIGLARRMEPAHGDDFLVRAEAAEVGLLPDDREGLTING